jgi:hypothetical protein
VELVDTQDLGSCGETRGGSSPSARTRKPVTKNRFQTGGTLSSDPVIDDRAGLQVAPAARRLIDDAGD